MGNKGMHRYVAFYTVVNQGDLSSMEVKVYAFDAQSGRVRADGKMDRLARKMDLTVRGRTAFGGHDVGRG